MVVYVNMVINIGRAIAITPLCCFCVSYWDMTHNEQIICSLYVYVYIYYVRVDFQIINTKHKKRSITPKSSE